MGGKVLCYCPCCGDEYYEVIPFCPDCKCETRSGPRPKDFCHICNCDESPPPQMED